MKKELTNTAKQDDPLGFLLDAIVFGASGSIERQEAQGQRELVNADVLPTKIDGMTALESLGFRFMGQVEGDPLFQRVEMPEGWRKAATDHPMWSNLMDAKGRVRGVIFYKAASYDRKAHMRMKCRYMVQEDYTVNDAAVYQVLDCDSIIHTTDAYKVALAWLSERYPDHANPAAYWNEDGGTR